MKKLLLLCLSLSMAVVAYSQETEEKKNLLIYKTEDQPDNSLVYPKSSRIIFNNFEVEADSAVYDSKINLLTSFGTRNFTFDGKVVLNNEQSTGTCRYFINEETVYIE